MTVWTDLMDTSFKLQHKNVGGVQTRVLRAGQGEPVLFLHGISGHLEAFSRTIPVHSRHFAVHALDMLGHGYTGKPDYPYTLDRYAEHILNYLDAEQVDSAHLVGISLGGWVAAWLAIEHPDRVRRVTLIAPGGLKADPATMTRIRESTQAGVRSTDRVWTRRRLEQLMASAESVTDELVDVRYAIYHQPVFAERLEQILVLEDPDVRPRYLLTDDRLRRLQAETLVVWPVADPYGDVSDAERLAHALPHSRLEVMKNCGHWPPFERAEEFAAINIPFLTSGLSGLGSGAAGE